MWPRWRTKRSGSKAARRGGPGSWGLDFILKDLQLNEHLRESARAAELVQRTSRPCTPGETRA